MLRATPSTLQRAASDENPVPIPRQAAGIVTSLAMVVAALGVAAGLQLAAAAAGTISGTVFEDLDADGTIGAGESGIGGVDVVAIDADGTVAGCQTKNQIAPEEDPYYVPGGSRELFEVSGVPFGIAICHEGWRYPESVRWAAVRGAKIVFHPHHAGSNRDGVKVTTFGAANSPYYEKAMLCRSLENGIWFASVGYALAYQEAATAVIDPEGDCVAHQPYGEPGVLFADIDPDAASGLYAARYAPATYG